MTYPPSRLEEAQKFAVCQPYKDWHICIYAGGGSARQHYMFWAFIIYTQQGDRQHYGYLPNDCLDVNDGMQFCERKIDRWQAPLDYEEICQWRNICEFMAQSPHSVYSAFDIVRYTDADLDLLSTDRTRRQLLWDLYKIQLIIWDYGRDGWRLKGNWEDKIWFLEQVYILGQDPSTLSRHWLDRWEVKQRAKELLMLDQDLKWVLERLQFVESDFLTQQPWETLDSEFGQRRLKMLLESIVRTSSQARQKLRDIRQTDADNAFLEEFDLTRPEPSSEKQGDDHNG